MWLLTDHSHTLALWIHWGGICSSCSIKFSSSRYSGLEESCTCRHRISWMACSRLIRGWKKKNKKQINFNCTADLYQPSKAKRKFNKIFYLDNDNSSLSTIFIWTQLMTRCYTISILFISRKQKELIRDKRVIWKSPVTCNKSIRTYSNCSQVWHLS